MNQDINNEIKYLYSKVKFIQDYCCTIIFVNIISISYSCAISTYQNYYYDIWIFESFVSK